MRCATRFKLTASRVQEGHTAKYAISGFISSYLFGPSIRLLSSRCYQLGHLFVIHMQVGIYVPAANVTLA